MALAWNAGWVNALAGSNPASSAIGELTNMRRGMGRKVAILWHASFSIGAGFLYFFFVLPRWHELMGETSHTLGTALRIVAGVLVGLAALPVVFTLLRTRKPELGTPQLALSLRTWSIVAHVLAGVLIIGTAISEIWLSLDAAGQWLFGIYGAAAAIAVLGFFSFYLSFVAELPPPPPKPITAKKPKKRDIRRKKAEADENDEADEAEAPEETPVAEEPEPDDTEDARAGLQNRRPSGKGSHRMRRRRTPGGVAVEE